MSNEGFLTRTECTAMKGIAILGIMLHNYCHWLKGIARENEYTWSQWKCDRMWEVFQQPDDLLPMHLVSYFGHYGVPVFLFLSGFGLVRKYEACGAAMPSVWRFTRYNYLKLFRIFIVGFVLFTMLDAFTPGIHRYHADEVLAMLGMYANFFEHPSEVVWPGPYWYFSITLQLYILYRLVICRWRHWVVVAGLIALCWLWQSLYLDDAVVLERLRYNLVGGMLPFGMGVLAARSGMQRMPVEGSWRLRLSLLLVLILSVSLAFHCSLSSAVNWLWAPAFIVVGTIVLVKLIPTAAMPYMIWLGGISAAVFVAHPLVRKIFVRPYIHEDMYAGLLLYIVATLLVSWLVKKIIDQIPSPRL